MHNLNGSGGKYMGRNTIIVFCIAEYMLKALESFLCIRFIYLKLNVRHRFNYPSKLKTCILFAYNFCKRKLLYCVRKLQKVHIFVYFFSLKRTRYIQFGFIIVSWKKKLAKMPNVLFCKRGLREKWINSIFNNNKSNWGELYVFNYIWCDNTLNPYCFPWINYNKFLSMHLICLTFALWFFFFMMNEVDIIYSWIMSRIQKKKTSYIPFFFLRQHSLLREKRSPKGVNGDSI